MAIIYSYPQGTPELQDLLLGTHIDSNGNHTKSFSILDIANLIIDYTPVLPVPTLQEVTTQGNSITNAIVVDTDSTAAGTFNSISSFGINATSYTSYGVYGSSYNSVGIYASSYSGVGIYANSASGIAAVKPGGGSWAAPSDSRVKENVLAYKKGLKEVILINPVTYDYNGLGGMPKSTGYVGIIAQDIKDIFPETIKILPAKLNETDAKETDLLVFDNNALIYALINAVKELSAEIDLLKEK